ncbi:MAG: hypothetical protein NVSMB62_21880 [Acidobacteriaceae bacterium]
MTPTRNVCFPALLLSGCLGVAAAQSPAQPTTPDAPAAATQPAAPIERQAPAVPAAPRPPRAMAPRFPTPMPLLDRDIRVEIHGPMGQNFHILPPGLWWRDTNVVQRLSLTPEQTKKMDDIFQQSRLQLIDLKANIERQNAILDPMLNANPIDQSKTLAQIDKVAQARAELEKADAKMLLGIRGVLTPDQWTKLQTRGARGDRDRGREPAE